jgi:transposase
MEPDMTVSAVARLHRVSPSLLYGWRRRMSEGGKAAIQADDEVVAASLLREVVRKLADQQGFQVLPRRWVVERTFGWMTRWRRLVRDYEHRCDVSEAMIHVSMGALLIRRIAHP